MWDNLPLVKVIIFAVVSVGAIFVSWASLRNLRSYGFYRFFAFESLLVLVLLNVDHWFHDPFSATQIISWALLIASFILAVHGFHLLRVIGDPEEGVETTTLVTLGAYKYIRHPLYSSLLFLAWGIFFKDPSSIGGLLALAATLFLVAAGRVEEAENLCFFGEVYKQYMKQTKMFIPYLF